MKKEDIIAMAREAGGLPDPMVFIGAYERFATLVEAKAAAAERNKLAAWMMQFGFATGHGDKMEQLIDALGTEIVDMLEWEVKDEREACAKVADEMEKARCEAWHQVLTKGGEVPSASLAACAAAIRARGQA